MTGLAEKLGHLAIGSEALENLHLEKLRKLLLRVYQRSPYYRQKFDAAGVDPHQFHALDDFAR